MSLSLPHRSIDVCASLPRRSCAQQAPLGCRSGTARAPLMHRSVSHGGRRDPPTSDYPHRSVWNPSRFVQVGARSGTVVAVREANATVGSEVDRFECAPPHSAADRPALGKWLPGGSSKSTFRRRTLVVKKDVKRGFVKGGSPEKSSFDKPLFNNTRRWDLRQPVRPPEISPQPSHSLVCSGLVSCLRASTPSLLMHGQHSTGDDPNRILSRWTTHNMWVFANKVVRRRRQRAPIIASSGS